MTSHAALLFPSLRWDPTHGFADQNDRIDRALEIGVGGFLISGGPRTEVAALTRVLRQCASLPLLLAADVERGAGQQFEGCLGLPPFSALGSLADPDIMRRAARITARELNQLGFNWALAPVCDLDVPPGNAVVGTRAAGSDPTRVASLVPDWIDACQAEGVLACAKHFPGCGRATEDPPNSPPTVHAPSDELWREDLVPFSAAVDAGVASVMTAHVAYPSLDPSGAPAALSAPILTELLRAELAFDGLVVSDSLETNRVGVTGAESTIAVQAIAAGCDVLLGVADVRGVARALERAEQVGALRAERVRDALDRRQRWALWGGSAGARETTLDDTMWSRQCADRSVHLVRGALPRLGTAVELIEVDDDEGTAGPAASRAHFAITLRELDVDAPVVPEPSAHTRVPVLIAAYSNAVAWTGAAAFSAASCARVARTIALAAQGHRATLVVLFAHPRHAAQFHSAPNVLCAWGGETPSLAAAARALALA